MYGWKNNRLIIKSLKDSFIVTDSELVHIQRVYSASSILSYTSHTSSYREVHLQVDATSYQLNNDSIEKEKINDVFFMIDTSQIIKISEENIGLLLIDDLRLVRYAAQEWYNKKAS